jgi:hypothetical protein
LAGDALGGGTHGGAKSGDLGFGVSLDCAEPAKLATFCLNLLGGKLLWHKKDSVGVRVPGVFSSCSG